MNREALSGAGTAIDGRGRSRQLGPSLQHGQVALGSLPPGDERTEAQDVRRARDVHQDAEHQQARRGQPPHGLRPFPVRAAAHPPVSETRS